MLNVLCQKDFTVCEFIYAVNLKNASINKELGLFPGWG